MAGKHKEPANYMKVILQFSLLTLPRATQCHVVVRKVPATTTLCNMNQKMKGITDFKEAIGNNIFVYTECRELEVSYPCFPHWL